MLPYTRGLILDNTNNYGIVKTETVFGFAPKGDSLVDDTFNSTQPLEWIFTHGNFGHRSLPDAFPSMDKSRSFNEEPNLTVKPQTLNKAKEKTKQNGKKQKTLHRNPKKHHKCIFKVIKKGQKKKNKSHKYKMNTKMNRYMLPVILGLLAAKGFLLPIALKALAFMSTKGLMMGFFSTVMASVLSLKGMFDHSHYPQNNRKDSTDSKTQVEIIQVPQKSEDHVYYDEHYKRGDLLPALLSRVGYDGRM